MVRPVDLYFWTLRVAPDDMPAQTDCLSPDEVARMGRFVYDRHRHAYLAARAGMRRILGGVTGRAPADLSFDYGPQGKPSLKGGPQFNLSHAADLACLAIHPDLPLGVDIEAHRDVETGLPDRFFSASEVRALAALPADQWQAGFFRCWTRKEAVIKALGGGLSIPLDAFAVSLDDAADARLIHLDAAHGAASDWALAPIATPRRMSGAIAARTGGAPIALRIAQAVESIHASRP